MKPAPPVTRIRFMDIGTAILARRVGSGWTPSDHDPARASEKKVFGRSWPVSRILSVPLLTAEVDDHPSKCRDCSRPHATNPGAWAMGHRLIAPPYLVLLRVGFSLSRECRHRGGALLPHLFTLTRVRLAPCGAASPWRYLFLLHCPWGRPRWPLTSTQPLPSLKTTVESGLSSPTFRCSKRSSSQLRRTKGR